MKADEMDNSMFSISSQMRAVCGEMLFSSLWPSEFDEAIKDNDDCNLALAICGKDVRRNHTGEVNFTLTWNC